VNPKASKPRKAETSRWKDVVLWACIALNVHLLYQSYRDDPTRVLQGVSELAQSCPAPQPTLFAQQPPSSDHPTLKLAQKSFDKFLSRFYHENKLDSLAVGVVTSKSSIYEGFRGALRANETSDSADLRGKVDRHSIYRIASVSKVFATLEALILRDRGALNL
jgi:CubicO group peptidase (beta-lactamase class C family)